jgi:hypothetical protein
MVKPDGSEYYGYVLCYGDDLLAIEMDPQKTMEMLRRTYKSKEGSVKEPDIYLAADIKKYHVHDSDEPGRPCWAMSSKMYVKRSTVGGRADVADSNKYASILRLQTRARSDARAWSW